MVSQERASRCGCILFRVGQVLLFLGIILCLLGVFTSFWVVRPDVNYTRESIKANETLVTKRFGLFVACRQSEYGEGIGECGSVWDHTNFVSANSVRFIQFLSVVSCVLYIISMVLEVVQFLPLQKYRNFLAENRLVEMFAGIASVILLTAMVIFAGEVKNKAERVSGQEEEKSGWSFINTLSGLVLCAIALLLVTMLRSLPIERPGQKGGTWLRVASRASGQRA